MREYEVDWKSFEEQLPEKGTQIVVEVERNSGTCRAHRIECVTGTFLHLRAVPVDGKTWRKAGIKRKGGGIQHVSPSSRWYLKGSERLKVRAA